MSAEMAVSLKKLAGKYQSGYQLKLHAKRYSGKDGIPLAWPRMIDLRELYGRTKMVPAPGVEPGTY